MIGGNALEAILCKEEFDSDLRAQLAVLLGIFHVVLLAYLNMFVQEINFPRQISWL